MNFDELNLAPAILKAVREQGYETPTAIQAQAIPLVLAGHDLLGGAQTGTGKNRCLYPAYPATPVHYRGGNQQIWRPWHPRPDAHPHARTGRAN